MRLSLVAQPFTALRNFTNPESFGFLLTARAAPLPPARAKGRREEKKEPPQHGDRTARAEPTIRRWRRRIPSSTAFAEEFGLRLPSTATRTEAA